MLVTKYSLAFALATVVPQVAATCLNDETFTYVDGEKTRTCKSIGFVEEARLRLCTIQEVADACPFSCGSCCEDNPDFKWEKNNPELNAATCKWIAQKQKRIDRYCDKTKTILTDPNPYNSDTITIRYGCPVTCDYCNLSVPIGTTPAPTKAPTAAPVTPGPTPTQPFPAPSRPPSPMPSPFPTLRPTSSPSDAPPFRESSKEKPNILLILADDLGAGDLPFYFNSSLVDMPNLQKLADKGLRFTNAHATPLCAPSRYSLLSGNYPHRGEEKSGTWFFNDDHGNQFRGNQTSIAELLQQNGYHTSMFGKWHLGGSVPLVSPGKSNLTYIITDDNHDWSQAFIQGPHEIGFDKSLITASGIQHPPYAFFRNGYLDSPREETVYWEADSEHDMPFGTSIIGKDGGEGRNDWDSTAYNMIIANETIAFIDKHLDERPEDPFFVYAALGAVHIPHSPPDFASDGTQIKGSYPSSHLDMVHEVDKIVGTLIDSIEERMLSRDTIIIFTSDNAGLGKSKKFGHNASGPLRGYKGQVYEGGTRVPLLVQWDGEFPAGEVIEGLVGINDLYATIADITNVSIPNESAEDSISFKSYLELSAEEEIRKFMPTWKYSFNKKPQHSLRSKDYKLIHTPYAGTIEFYDLKNDIGETMDLSDVILHGDVMTEMYEELVRLGPCARDENGYVDTRYRKICNSQLNFHSAKDIIEIEVTAEGFTAY